MIEIPDPRYTSSARAQANFVLAVQLSFVLVLGISVAYVIDVILPHDLLAWGLSPREPAGLLGVVTAPFLHASLGHLLSNTVPLFVGFSLMFYLFPNASARAALIIYLGSGLLAWLFARQAIHVGASGMVYGVLAFLFVSGLLRRDLRSLGVSLMVAFVYGSIVWGVLPFDTGMSWELHLAGTLMGAGCAVVYRHWDRPPMKRYEWELEQATGEDDLNLFDGAGEVDWEEPTGDDDNESRVLPRD
ncbi:MAG TPA: rhomboid family intramembrane serine protease [Wenzhouxiangella sp.]